MHIVESATRFRKISDLEKGRRRFCLEVSIENWAGSYVNLASSGGFWRSKNLSVIKYLL
jgi:hypothetical protein